MMLPLTADAVLNMAGTVAQAVPLAPGGDFAALMTAASGTDAAAADSSKDGLIAQPPLVDHLPHGSGQPPIPSPVHSDEPFGWTAQIPSSAALARPVVNERAAVAGQEGAQTGTIVPAKLRLEMTTQGKTAPKADVATQANQDEPAAPLPNDHAGLADRDARLVVNDPRTATDIPGFGNDLPQLAAANPALAPPVFPMQMSLDATGPLLTEAEFALRTRRATMASANPGSPAEGVPGSAPAIAAAFTVFAGAGTAPNPQPGGDHVASSAPSHSVVMAQAPVPKSAAKRRIDEAAQTALPDGLRQPPAPMARTETPGGIASASSDRGASLFAAHVAALARDVVAISTERDVRFSVRPETLGPVAVTIEQRGDGAALKLGVDTQAAAQAVRQAEPALNDAAARAGSPFVQVSVDLQSPGQRDRPTRAAAIIKRERETAPLAEIQKATVKTGRFA